MLILPDNANKSGGDKQKQERPIHQIHLKPIMTIRLTFDESAA